jgi:hypothetical protein
LSEVRQYRVYFSRPPIFGGLGCVGCLFILFIMGGILGVLVFGWRQLLGM